MSSITILTLIPNAGDRLKPCLESIAWADDIFCVVDPNTTDGSEEVARQHTDHVVVHEYLNKADQCNWAIPQIETEWTMVLDADETVSPELAKRIQQVIADPDSDDGYKIRRRSYFFGKLIGHCGWDRDYNLRLFRTKKGRYQARRVHSTMQIDGTVGCIDEVMYHDAYRSFEEYFATSDRFSTWSAQDLFEKGERVGVISLLFRPGVRFLKMYVIRQGFRDGKHGLVLCILAAFSVFTKYAKLWNLNRQARFRG